ncbi:MAG: UvrD-helicase domain-containing protein [Sideroxyarcus sp.]|nr:UvrD-helicase domain-containing protein [Sideroxyarcus sp.]
MQFSTGFFGSLLTGSGRWKVNLDHQELSIQHGGSLTRRIFYPSVTSVTLTRGAIWSKVRIRSSDLEIELGGITNSHARLFKGNLIERVSDSLLDILNRNAPAVRTLAESLDVFLNLPKYLAHRDVTQWFARHESSHDESVKTTLGVLHHPFAPMNKLSPELRTGMTQLLDVFSDNADLLKKRNSEFVEREMIAQRALFDSVEKTPLTQEQRIASIVMEDRNLLVAAAGSGKTSTVVGKIGYALTKKLMAPEEILVLAFNNNAARELEERIQERLKPLLYGRQIKVKTFHALGLDVIAEATGKKPTIANFASGGEIADVQLSTGLINSLLSSDMDFLMQWTLFMSLCRKPAKNPAEFGSVQEWQSYVKETGVYHNKQPGYLTLNGEIVKSQGELAIANWLYISGVGYEYERAYQYETADQHHRQYKPDFYFPDINCYLEHYALDAKGNPPKAFGEKYRDSRIWKQHLHAVKGTDVFETTFAEFTSGVLFEKLEKELTQRGVMLKPRSHAEVIKNINLPKLDGEISSLLRTFIKHAKSNEMKADELASKANTTLNPFRARLFANIAGKVMSSYEKKLQDSNEVDFEDLIVDAARRAAGEDFKHPYKLILVDEFQDISRGRAKLLLSLLNKTPECQLFAVGDDWQSIYRFAGSDIAIFTDFQNTFGYTATNFLTQTFRSNQGIADIAANFVQRNPSQLKKSVKAIDKTVDNVVVLRQYERMQEMESLIEESLRELDAEARATMKQVKVFILGRYRNQAPEKLPHWNEQFAGLDIEFKTIHSSKGLQADCVILVGLHSGKNSFPSEMADDPLLQMVMPTPETFAHAEERRLFYVALTRAKHMVYVLGGKYSPSCFLDDLQGVKTISPTMNAVTGTDVNSQARARCPKCKEGYLRMRKGRKGDFLGCSKYPACNHTQDAN